MSCSNYMKNYCAKFNAQCGTNPVSCYKPIFLGIGRKNLSVNDYRCLKYGTNCKGNMKRGLNVQKLNKVEKCDNLIKPKCNDNTKVCVTRIAEVYGGICLTNEQKKENSHNIAEDNDKKYYFQNDTYFCTKSDPHC